MPNEPKKDVPTSDPAAEPISAVVDVTVDIHEAVQTIREACEVIRDALRLSLSAGQGMAGIRTVIAARGLDGIQARLDEGWELLHLDLCDEIRELGGTARRATSMAWVPYGILGKRDALAAADRAAILADEQRQLIERATPVSASQPDAPPPTPGPAPEEARTGHQVQPHRTQAVGSEYEGQGALAKR
jgi:hypothetical protein